jgi:hypothetical protein
VVVKHYCVRTFATERIAADPAAEEADARTREAPNGSESTGGAGSTSDRHIRRSAKSIARVFLLSPANASGERMRMLLRPEAEFDLARRVRAGEATLGEAFAFTSGLYFRGKLAYASAFARPAAEGSGVLVIAPGAGLVPAETRVDAEQIAALGKVPVDAADPRFRRPLLEASRLLLGTLPGDAQIVLLGSVASGKYVDPLLSVFAQRLLFPPTFVGRGDMSRGGLLLRCVRSREELEYAPVDGAVRHGPRPPRLPRLPRRE